MLRENDGGSRTVKYSRYVASTDRSMDVIASLERLTMTGSVQDAFCIFSQPVGNLRPKLLSNL